MNRPLRSSKKLPNLINSFRIGLNKDKYDSINIYFQDESRFGLMTHIGRYITAKGIKPIVKYKHAFKSTYVYGSFSPLTGDSFMWEINGLSTQIFEMYLKEFSKQNPRELKLVVIDNAGFHSTKNIDIPENIKLINIPPYTPELNPCERVWGYFKSFFKNKVFDDIEDVKDWIEEFVNNDLSIERIKSLTRSSTYNNCFVAQ